MTIAFPDVSNHNGAMTLQPDTVACLAKASEGTGYRDPYYAHFKAESARVGALFGAYHFLREGDGAAQARFAYSVIGAGVPTMIDFEPEYDADGNPISLPTLADAAAFRDAFRSLGGLIRLNYLPHEYWADHLGSPSLAPLADLALVSSDYTAYSDTGPGWAPYGGLTPAIWQWTDSLAYSGQRVDFNAYRGTIDQLRALLGLSNTEADMAVTLADANLIADEVLNRALGEIDLAGRQTGEKRSLGNLVAQSRAELDAKLDAVAAAVAKIAAPVDAKALAVAVVTGLTPIVENAVKAGTPIDYDHLAIVVESHLAATLAQTK